GSTDGTAAFLAELGGDVHIVRNADDVGFARACNQGAAAARGRHLVFLAPDVLPRPGWLATLVETAAAAPATAMVGSPISPVCLLVQRAAFAAAGGFVERARGQLTLRSQPRLLRP